MRLTTLALFVGVFFLSPVSGFGRSAGIPTQCDDGKECLIEVADTQCADGTPSFITLTKRPGAKNLLVFLTGGGACWSKETCEEGYAYPLSRFETPTDWKDGKGIYDSHDAANPFASDYNIITIPYCTGDVFAGNRDADYGTNGKPYVIRHRGYQNVVKDLAKIKELYPSPAKAVMLGCSAGGIGAYVHLRDFAKTFPQSHKFVISDAGTPFKPPYLIAENYQAIMKGWGADSILPTEQEAGEPVRDFGALIRFNTRRYTDIRFAFIDSYRDEVMTFFAWAVGSPSYMTAVKRDIIDVADHDIGRLTPNAKVFFTESSRHCHTPEALSSVTSESTDLSAWLNEMVGEDKAWESIRPDLHHDVLSSLDAPQDQRIHTVEDLRRLRH